MRIAATAAAMAAMTALPCPARFLDAACFDTLCNLVFLSFISPAYPPLSLMSLSNPGPGPVHDMADCRYMRGFDLPYQVHEMAARTVIILVTLLLLCGQQALCQWPWGIDRPGANILPPGGPTPVQAAVVEVPKEAPAAAKRDALLKVPTRGR